MKLYWRYFIIQCKSQLQHKASFLMLVFGQFLATFTSFLGIYFIMSRFQQVAGFTTAEVLLNFSIISFSYAMAEMFARGFDSFAQIIGNGEFDRMLVRPKNLFVQILGSRIELSRLGRLIQAFLMFAWVIANSNITWTADKILTISLMLIGGIIVFASLFLLYASLCFFTLEGLELINIFTDGGREFGQYPFSIYGEGVLKLLTFIIPLALVQYYPLLYLTGRSQQSALMFAPILATLFLIPVYNFWCFALNHYQSTGS